MEEIANGNIMGDIQESREKILEDLDNAKTGKFHFKTIFITGMGFFSDAYDLFVISAALPIIVAVFGLTGSDNIFGRTTVSIFGIGINAVSVETGLIGSMALFGAFIGALVFGRIADKKGRRYIYGLEMSILVVFAIVSALSVNVTMLIISRFILGIGIGGDYPISSTMMSEYANVKNRGKMVSSVFAMQGFGLLLGAFIGVVSIFFLPTDIAWRFMLGFGAIPAASVIYLRRKMKESPRFALQTRNDSAEAAAVTSIIGKNYGDAIVSGGVTKNYKEDQGKGLLRKYWVTIIGTSLSWLLLDMAFYGTSINNGFVLQHIGYGRASTIHQTVFNLAVGNALIASLFEVPGYWVAVATIDRVGRKRLQWIGFSVMALMYLILALKYTTLIHSFILFLAFYGIAFLFGNLGPNTTTFILPTELFPTRIRTTGHGIAASTGKLGAGIFTFLVPVLLVTMDVSGVLYILFGIAMMGSIVTMLTIRETRGKSLEESSSLPEKRGRYSSFSPDSKR
ncbi:MFS transporter [Oxyplasma meridianum]|uniref:MFS transporter n=1 Tax=Oxyplasma meridianum TaxID=3073602 RepID=A0AAX4NHE7_9ARCH